MKPRSIVVPRGAVLLVWCVLLAFCQSCSSKSPKSLLEERTASSWIVDVDAKSGVVTFGMSQTSGKTYLPKGGDALEAALQFLDENKDVFRMLDPRKELALDRTRATSDGLVHVRFLQQANAKPVFATMFSVHFDAKGAVAFVTGPFIPGLGPVASQAPTLDANAAVAAAQKDLAARTPGFSPTWVANPPTPVLGVYALSGGVASLAYHLSLGIASPTQLRLYDYEIDARSGAVLDFYDDTNLAVGTGTGSRGDTKQFPVRKDGQTYSMVQEQTQNATLIRTGACSSSNDFLCRATWRR